MKGDVISQEGEWSSQGEEGTHFKGCSEESEGEMLTYLNTIELFGYLLLLFMEIQHVSGLL